MLLDSGASISCIAKRCVTSNHVLRDIPSQPYNGPRLVGANGLPLTADVVIRVEIEIGSPKLVKELHFVVVENLSYSCIAGMNFLKTLEHWGVNNKSNK